MVFWLSVKELDFQKESPSAIAREGSPNTNSCCCYFLNCSDRCYSDTRGANSQRFTAVIIRFPPSAIAREGSPNTNSCCCYFLNCTAAIPTREERIHNDLLPLLYAFLLRQLLARVRQTPIAAAAIFSPSAIAREGSPNTNSCCCYFLNCSDRCYSDTRANSQRFTAVIIRFPPSAIAREGSPNTNSCCCYFLNCTAAIPTRERIHNDLLPLLYAFLLRQLLARVRQTPMAAAIFSTVPTAAIPTRERIHNDLLPLLYAFLLRQLLARVRQTPIAAAATFSTVPTAAIPTREERIHNDLLPLLYAFLLRQLLARVHQTPIAAAAIFSTAPLLFRHARSEFTTIYCRYYTLSSFGNCSRGFAKHQ